MDEVFYSYLEASYNDRNHKENGSDIKAIHCFDLQKNRI